MGKVTYSMVICCLISILNTSKLEAQTTNERNKIYINSISKFESNNEKNNKVLSSKLILGLKELSEDNGSSKMLKNIITKGNYVLVSLIPVHGLSELKKELDNSERILEPKIVGNMVQGWIDFDRLGELEKNTIIKKIMPVFKGSSNIGTVTTQGEIAMKADKAKLNYGVNGEGVKVGIISTSYDILKGANESIFQGDLPGKNNPNGFNKEVVILSELFDENITDFGNDEGRAMAEIVHDIAPGAELYLYSGLNGRANFVEGIKELTDAGCDIIVDDVFYREQPYFQDGDVSRAVNWASKKGVTYFTSAGNKGRKSYESRFEDSGVTVQGNILHDFGNTDISQSITIEPFGFIDIWLQWDDPSLFVNPNGPSPDTDLNLFLLDANTGDILSSSTFNNIEEGVPLEFVFFENYTNQPREVELVIGKAAGPFPKKIKYIDFGFGGDINEYTTNSGTSVGHQNARGAITVGAAFYGNTPEFGNELQIESSSSAGGVPILMNFKGKRLRRPRIRRKPDIIVPDGGNNTFFGVEDVEGDGFPNFFGTSAAAPHAAAVGALIEEISNKEMSSQAIKWLMQRTAIDMDDPLTSYFDRGFDFATGYGFLEANKALGYLSYFYNYRPNYCNYVFYPNPSQGIVYFKNNNEKNIINFSILNATGFILDKFSLEKSQVKSFDFSKYKPGLFIIRAKSNNSVSIEKIIIRR